MIFFRVVLLVCAVGFSSPAPAADFVVPKQSVVVAAGDSGTVIPPGKPVPLGELVEITVTKPGEVIPHLEAVSYDWKILEDGKERKFKTFDGTAVWYAAGIAPKRQQVFCVVTFLYAVREKPEDSKSPITRVATRQNFLYVEVLIGDANPPNPPGPGPVGPVFPDGKYGLAKKAYEAAVKNVPQENRAKAAKALAESFKGMASAIKAGAVKEVKDILVKTASSNQAKLKEAGVEKEVWEAFFKVFQDEIYELYDADQLVTPEQFADAWTEIAQGLEQVR